MDDLKKQKLIKKIKKRKSNLSTKGILASLEYTELRHEQYKFLNELLEILEEK